MFSVSVKSSVQASEKFWKGHITTQRISSPQWKCKFWRRFLYNFCAGVVFLRFLRHFTCAWVFLGDICKGSSVRSSFYVICMSFKFILNSPVLIPSFFAYHTISWKETATFGKIEILWIVSKIFIKGHMHLWTADGFQASEWINNMYWTKQRPK